MRKTIFFKNDAHRQSRSQSLIKAKTVYLSCPFVSKASQRKILVSKQNDKVTGENHLSYTGKSRLINYSEQVHRKGGTFYAFGGCVNWSGVIQQGMLMQRYQNCRAVHGHWDVRKTSLPWTGQLMSQTQSQSKDKKIELQGL